MFSRREGLRTAHVLVAATAAAMLLHACADPVEDTAPDTPAERLRDVHFTAGTVTALGAPAGESQGHVSDSSDGMAPRPVAASAVATQVDGHARYVVGYEDATTMRGASYEPVPPVAMAYAWSDDGTHWTRSEVTGFEHTPVPIAATLGSPALAAEPGRSDVYYAALAVRRGFFPNSSRVIVVAHSTDGGATFLPATIATMPQIGVAWDTADSPSLSVDDTGLVHLVFVADQGTDHARIQHWTGIRQAAGCTFTCMSWAPATAPDVDPADAPYVRHPILRTYHRSAYYVAYEVRTPMHAPAPRDDASFRIVMRRYNVLYDSWDPTDVQPGNGATYGIVTNPLGGTQGGGVRMDFALDPATGDGLVVWVGNAQPQHEDTRDAVYAQRFHFVSVFEEAWDGPMVVGNASGSTSTAFQPTASLAGDVRAVTWLASNGDAATVRLMGSRSDDRGVTYVPARNLTLVDGAWDATMPLCPSDTSAWSAYGSSVTTPGTGGTPLTLTVHVDARDGSCNDARATPGVGSTRWGLPVP